MSNLRDTVQKIFSVSGPLSSLPGFEYRPQQLAMAEAILDALESRLHLMVEAPTGVGKSVAYLVPAILYGLKTGRKAVVSTHTRTLQDQLFGKDLPLVRLLLGCDVDAVVLKGRHNYLCTHRLRQALDAPGSMFDEEAREQLELLQEWAAAHPEGDLDTLDTLPRADLLELVWSEPGVCTLNTCGPACPFQRVRERAREADLVVMNHALFFALLAGGEVDDRYIYEDDFVVFDEAHTLETVATQGLGGRVSRRQMVNAIRRLYNSSTRKGLVPAAGIKGLRKTLSDTERAVDRFFDAVRRHAEKQPGQSAPAAVSRHVRVRDPQLVPDSVTPAIAALRSKLRQSGNNADTDVKREIEAVLRSLDESVMLIGRFLDQPDNNSTFWIELSGGRSAGVTLCSAPVDVGPILADRLFRPGSSVILTSATLSVAGSFDYVRQRLGGGSARTLTLSSPFDHARQMRVSIAGDIPAPDSERYAEALPRYLLRAIERTRGRALVLFTSIATMQAAARALAGPLAERDLPLLVQGEDRQRQQLLEEFRRNHASVLFGLDSFWMGIDVPGESLSHVIITKLPFSVPNNPIVEARTESIVARNGNPFMEYALPEAILKFRQGAGRLIRTTSDTGIVTILDSRLARKAYGRLFLQSLPPCPLEMIAPDGVAREIDTWVDWSTP